MNRIGKRSLALLFALVLLLSLTVPALAENEPEQQQAPEQNTQRRRSGRERRRDGERPGPDRGAPHRQHFRRPGERADQQRGLLYLR